jgi:hypothetical protein
VPAPRSFDSIGLWKSAAKNIAGPSGAQGSQAGAPLAAGNDVGDTANMDNRPAHTRTNTAASGSNQTAISRLDSAVSQVPALPGSFEGLSGIGGQNELGYVFSFLFYARFLKFSFLFSFLFLFLF